MVDVSASIGVLELVVRWGAECRRVYIWRDVAAGARVCERERAVGCERGVGCGLQYTFLSGTAIYY